jgi:hypothetical protein
LEITVLGEDRARKLSEILSNALGGPFNYFGIVNALGYTPYAADNPSGFATLNQIANYFANAVSQAGSGDPTAVSLRTGGVVLLRDGSTVTIGQHGADAPILLETTRALTAEAALAAAIAAKADTSAIPDLTAKADTSVVSALSTRVTGLDVSQSLALGVGLNGKAAVTQISAGALTARSLPSHFGDTLSIKDFGAVCDGLADDTVAVQAAIDAAVLQRKRLYTPGGFVRLTGALYADGAFSLFGDGSNISQWIWDSSSITSGLAVSLGQAFGFSQGLSIADVGFLTKRNLDGNALSVTSPSTAADRFTVRVVVKNFLVRGYTNPFIDGWVNGILFDGVPRVLVDGFCFLGKIIGLEPNYGSNTGILYNNDSHATPHGTECMVVNSFITCVQFGLVAGDMEGLFVRGCNMFAVGVGITAGDGSADYPHAVISQNYIQATVICIKVNRMFEVFIVDNLLYSQLSQVTSIGVQVVGNANYFLIKGNIFENYNPALPQNSVVVSSGGKGLVDGNIFRRSNSLDGNGHGTGIWFTNGASGCTATNTNMFDGQVFTPMLDQGTGNIMAFSLKGLSSYSSGNDGVITQYGSTVVTLNASGVGVIGFPLPFKNSFKTAVISNGDPVFVGGLPFVVTHVNCTKFILAFQVVGVSGGMDTVRVEWIAYGD